MEVLSKYRPLAGMETVGGCKPAELRRWQARL